MSTAPHNVIDVRTQVLTPEQSRLPQVDVEIFHTSSGWHQREQFVVTKAAGKLQMSPWFAIECALNELQRLLWIERTHSALHRNLPNPTQTLIRIHTPHTRVSHGAQSTDPYLISLRRHLNAMSKSFGRVTVDHDFPTVSPALAEAA